MIEELNFSQMTDCGSCVRMPLGFNCKNKCSGPGLQVGVMSYGRNVVSVNEALPGLKYIILYASIQFHSVRCV